MRKIDYYLGGFLGFLTGVFAVPTAFNLGVKGRLILALLPLVAVPVFMLGLWLGGLVSRKLKFFGQFSRFVAVGFLNTAIDFGILNMLSSLTGITSGLIIGGVNVPGFAVAFVNSYLWNKLWVFSGKEYQEKENLFSDLPKFLVVTLVGLFLNSGIVVLATTYIHPNFVSSAKAWLNVAKALATVTNLIWNFLGYRLWVFAKKQII